MQMLVQVARESKDSIHKCSERKGNKSCMDMKIIEQILTISDFQYLVSVA